MSFDSEKAQFLKKPDKSLAGKIDRAIKKLVDLGIAIINNDIYIYSPLFEHTAQSIISSPLNKIQQIKLGNEAGRKLLPQILAMTISKPSRRDIENMLTAYVCLIVHIKQQNLEIDNKIIPDLAYAIWYLNDHKPTIKEVEEWNLTSPQK